MCSFFVLVICFGMRTLQSASSLSLKFLSARIVAELRSAGDLPYGSPNVTNPNYFVNRNWFGFVFYC